jgi:hypothetical protein
VAGEVALSLLWNFKQQAFESGVGRVPVHNNNRPQARTPFGNL